MEVVVKFQIFNYSVELVIEVNQIAAIVKCIIIKWGLIVVKEAPQSSLKQPPSNVLEPLKKELDVEIGQSIPVADAITTNNIKYEL